MPTLQLALSHIALSRLLGSNPFNKYRFSASKENLIELYQTFPFPFLSRCLYLNKGVFLSVNYRLIVAPSKFVLKTNMLVLRTSNFQETTITLIVPRQTLYCLYCSPLNFLPCVSSKITLNCFQLFTSKAWKPNVKFEKENRQKPT